MAPFPIGKFVETFLDQSKDDARRLIRHEMESMLDPLVESLFKQLKNKFVHYLEDSSSSSCFHQELILEHNIGVDEHLIRDQQTISNCYQYDSHSLSNAHSIDANCQVNSTNHLLAFMSIKQEINDPSNVLFEPQHNQHSVNSSSSTLESMIASTATDLAFPNTEMQQQPQPQQLVHIKHNQFDDEEECDCDECVDGGIEAKEEDDEEDNDSFQWIDDDEEYEQTRAVKRPRMDITQPNEDRLNDESGRIESEQNIDTQATIADVHVELNSDESMVIQQKESDVNNAIGEEIATECTTNPIQPNLLHPNLKFQCSHCPKSYVRKHDLKRHLQLLTGERTFPCDYCDKQFIRKDKLDSHLLTHSGERPFARQHCAKSFASSDTLNTHEQAIHLHVRPELPQVQRAPFKKAQPNQKVSKQFITVHLQCPISECPDKFPQEQLNQHMLDVHLLGPHRCQVKDCHQSFVNNVLLWRHLLQAHQHITQWHCDKCSKYFAQYQILSNHKHLYHQVGYFECSFPGCTFTGKYKGKVVSHYTQKHKLSQRPDLVCQQSGCDYRTKYTSSLKEHERVHLGIKPFRCKWSHCGYSSFYKRYTLIHIRTQHLDRVQNSNQTVVTSVDPRDFLEVVE